MVFMHTYSEQCYMINKSVNKIEFIQALRGIAALCVVLYHGSYWTGKWAETTKEIFFAAGYFGVSLFFVISGFIMVITTKKSNGSLSYVKTFMIKRFMRIWPAYFIATVVSFILLAGASWFANWDNLIYLARSMLFMPSGTAPAPTFGTPVLSVGWTLTYEMIFYIFFAISMLAGKLRWLAFYSCTALFLIGVPTYISGGFSTTPTFDYGFRSILLGLITSPIIWMFVSGVVIGQIYTSRIILKNETFCWMMVLFSVTFAISQYVSGSRVGHGIFEWGTSIVPLMLCLTIASKTIHIKIPKHLVYLGDISFSLYLMHVLMQGVTLHFLVYVGLNGFAQGISSLIMTTLMSIIAASLFHKYVESFFSSRFPKWIFGKIKMEAKAADASTASPVVKSTPPEF